VRRSSRIELDDVLARIHFAEFDNLNDNQEL
jgi:hypothetical protein